MRKSGSSINSGHKPLTPSFWGYFSSWVRLSHKSCFCSSKSPKLRTSLGFQLRIFRFHATLSLNPALACIPGYVPFPGSIWITRNSHYVRLVVGCSTSSIFFGRTNNCFFSFLSIFMNALTVLEAHKSSVISCFYNQKRFWGPTVFTNSNHRFHSMAASTSLKLDSLFQQLTESGLLRR